MLKYSDATLQVILSKFIEDNKKHNFSPITNGYINATFLVTETTTPKYILQRINPSVFPDAKALMQNITKALHVLQHDAYTTIEFLKTENGEAYFTTTNGVWRVMKYINNSIVYTTTTQPIIAYEAGKIISTFHSLVQKEYAKDYKETLPDFHNLEARKKQFLIALEKAPADRINNAKKVIERTAHFLSILEPLMRPKLPVRLCHNDTKLNNILFSKTNNKALCLIDLDTLMKGYFFYDFGDAARTIANTAAEDEKDLNKITFNKELFSAFIDGLKNSTRFLSASELKTLPLGVVFMPFIHGLRALTDYLNGNIYYQVTYENQNLDRCLSLFNFAEKAYAEIDFISKEVKQLTI